MVDIETIDKINLKVKEMQGEIQVLRLQVQGIELKEKNTLSMKDQLFTYSENLEQKSILLKAEINRLKARKSEQNEFECEELKIKIMRIETEHKDALRKKIDEIEDLKADILDLQKKNKDLEDELASQSTALLPKVHTNTSYLNKMIK